MLRTQAFTYCLADAGSFSFALAVASFAMAKQHANGFNFDNMSGGEDVSAMREGRTRVLVLPSSHDHDISTCRSSFMRERRENITILETYLQADVVAFAELIYNVIIECKSLPWFSDQSLKLRNELCAFI